MSRHERHSTARPCQKDPNGKEEKQPKKDKKDKKDKKNKNDKKDNKEKSSKKEKKAKKKDEDGKKDKKDKKSLAKNKDGEAQDGAAKVYKTSLYHRMYSRAYHKRKNAGDTKEACRLAAQEAAKPYLSAKKGNEQNA